MPPPWTKVNQWPWPPVLIFIYVLTKSTICTIFPYKSIKEQSWPCCEVGQGQPRIIIWTTYQSPSPWCYIPCLKVISLLVSEKRICFNGLLPYMGMAAILVTWPGPFEQTFILTTVTHKSATWNVASMGEGTLQEMFETINLKWPWSKVQQWPWPLILITYEYMYWLSQLLVPTFSS